MAHTSKMESQWRMPEKGWVKLNVHGYYTPKALTNGNKTGVGAVLRNDQGKIVKMLTGTRSGYTEKRNMSLAMMLGLRLAWEEGANLLILETDNWLAYQGFCGKWVEECSYELEQIKKRKDDRNMKIEPYFIHPSANKLATYLARNGAETRTDLLVTNKPHGNVLHLWYEDMGLGSPSILFIYDEDCPKQEAWKASVAENSVEGKKYLLNLNEMEEDGASN